MTTNRRDRRGDTACRVARRWIDRAPGGPTKEHGRGGGTEVCRPMWTRLTGGVGATDKGGRGDKSKWDDEAPGHGTTVTDRGEHGRNGVMPALRPGDRGARSGRAEAIPARAVHALAGTSSVNDPEPGRARCRPGR